MGDTHWGLGIRFIFMCIVFVTVSQKCVGGGNLTTASCSEQERLALLKFKQSVIDEHGMLSSWRVGSDCCRWERVSCDDSTGRVVSLHLRSYFKVQYYLDDHAGLLDEYDLSSLEDLDYHLFGDEVNSCLTELVNLKHLDLSGNSFRKSQIPEFIGSLKHLRYLNLSNAGFSGNIPHQIGNLSNLKVLDISSSPYHSKELMTDDMTWISGLSKLEHLDLSGVDLSRVQNLDKILYTIPSLFTLSLSRCGVSMSHLGSHHPNSSKELSKFKHLDLSENDFRGQLPGLILNMTSISFLDLSKNNMSMVWSFENFINMIPSVSQLSLSGCGLQKHNLAPASLNSSTNFNIQHLDLSDNEIEGRFPSVLTNMSSLLSLNLWVNRLNSPIPIMHNLLKLDISGNNISNIEDVGIWRQCHLKELIGSFMNNLGGEMIGPSTNVSECSQYALEILHMGENKISNSIPEAIGKLTNLRSLDLSYNALTGPIPKSLGNLISLQGLYLSYNSLTGSLPEFHGQLTMLCIAFNQLSGYIPESLGRLKALTGVFLESNRLIGPVPVSIGRLASLRVFSVASNLLNGTLPNSIGQLTELYLLDVSNNSLQGVVSENHFSKLSALKFLNANENNNLLFNISREWIPPFQLKVARLSSCKIEDEFPQWFQTQRKLDELVLSNASISGPLPTWLHLLPVLYLDLSHNKLTGPLSNVICVGCEFKLGLLTLLLQNNLFEGLIPRLLCTLKRLDVLDLSGNRLTGKVPKCLWNLAPRVLILSSNRLSGVIPSSLDLLFMDWLQLNDNNFSGELPPDFGCSMGLIVLDLGENKFSGNIPECFGENALTLAALRFHKNNFTGRIPHSLCKAQALQILDLAHNNLRGSIPPCFGELDGMKEKSWFDFYMGYGNMMQVLKGVTLDYTKTVQYLRNMDFSSNKLVGEIPKELTTLDGLMGLNLSYNCFSGHIPENIGKMKSLNSLDLSANKFNGTIPPSIAALNFLSYLNLSHNNLSGQIPTGNQLQTLIDPSIYADNPYLCGAPLPKECSPHKKPPTTTSKNKGGHANEPKKVWFYLDIMSGFATGFWGIIGVLMLKKQWRHKLFMFCEEIMDKIYVAVAVRVLKMKRGWVGA